MFAFLPSTVKREELTATAVTSCTKPCDQKCGFFLTDVDDSEARLAKLLNVPLASRIPAQSRTQSWLTHGTGSNSVLFGGSATRTRNLNLSNSPTSYNYRGSAEGRGDKEADELASLVIGLLRRDGVAIRSQPSR